MRIKFFLIYIFFYFFLFFSILKSENTDWFQSNGNNQAQRYSNLDLINTKNILGLKNIWIYENGFKPPSSPRRTNSQLTPIFTGKSLIVNSVDGYLISLNPGTGEEIWRTKLRTPVAKRGVTYASNKIFVPTSQGVVVINENDGSINKNFGENGFIGYYGEDFLTLLPPIIEGNNLLVAHQKKIESYKLPEGKTNWSLNLNGARIWSGFSYDKETKTIAVVTSNLINLIGETNIYPDYSNSLILINSSTGKVKCSFKDTLHDHWDMDMTGSPIFTFIKKNNSKIKVVYGFSKTGNIFVIDVNKCDFIHKDSHEILKVETKTDIPNQTYSPIQKRILKPVNIVDLKYNMSEYVEYLEKNNMDTSYIKFISRNAKYGENFIPLSINYDVIMNGIHGGPEWPGATLDKRNEQIIIPTNHYPWIIRTYYREINQKKNFKDRFNSMFNFSKKILNEEEIIYQTKCQSCHGSKREGVYQSEFFGDKYIPSLIGVSFTDKVKSLENKENFIKSHSFLKKKIDVTEVQINKLKIFFKQEDQILKDQDLLELTAKWQLLLNEDKSFASKPPWGKITAFDVNNGSVNWSVPFGIRKNINNEKILGDINFGGVLSTRGNLLVATGTSDNFIRILNSVNGKEIWKYKMKYAGSAPPMTYLYNGNQYLIVNASGGRFFGFEKKLGDRFYAFKLKEK